MARGWTHLCIALVLTELRWDFTYILLDWRLITIKSLGRM